jgi:hypothetical protein
MQFILPDFADMRKRKSKKVYQNPIYRAMEWQKMLDSGQYKSKAEFAKYLGVSRVRVIQMLNLLKLDSHVIDKLKGVGETFDKKLFGEKTLRTLLKLSPENQKLRLNL